MIRKNEVFPLYRKCVKELTSSYNYIKSLYTTDYVSELCKLRGYVSEEQRKLISDMQLGCCEISNTELLGDMRFDLGLVSGKDNFLLSGRYIIPVEDMSGNLVALIGYFPDVKKYITTPSPFFDKECLFFNFKQAYELSYKEYGGIVYVVEGIFDCLSLRSIGLPTIATMGSSVSNYKFELLKLFKKVIAIPDNDKTGKKALNKFSKSSSWKLPFNTTVVKFEGGVLDLGGIERKVKDMDNFVSWYDVNDVREILLSYKDSREDLEILRL